MIFDCNSDESSCGAEGVHMRDAHASSHFLKFRSVFESCLGLGEEGM